VSTAQLFLACTAIWGTTWIAITFQLGDVDAAASIAYRFFIASALLYGWQRVRGTWRALPLVEHAWFIFLGALYAANYQLIYFAEGTLPSGLVAVSGASILFFNLVLARLFFRTRVTLALSLACMIGSSGIVLVFFDEIRAFSLDGRGLAVAAALFGAFSASCANMVAQRFARQNVPVMTTNTLWMGYASLLTVLFIAIGPAEFGFLRTTGYVVSLLYLGVFGSVLAFSAFFTLLGKIGVGPAGYVAVSTPVVALAVSSVVEDLSWPLTRVLGVACILVGQLVLVRRKSVRPAPPSLDDTR
jgi:drug/metabolite transporter (DMT)-like permease